MGTTTVTRVTADLLFDVGHVIDFDDETGEEITEGRWVLTIEAPGADVERISKSVGALVDFADRWGRDRGVFVDINFLMPLGGP